MYDFRKRPIFYGPISDLIPSTPVFEMYPFGFTTIAAHLHDQGYKVRIVNLASLMLSYKDLDVESLLRRLDAEVFGIDLHWLPHAHGALAVAEIVKSLHPNSKVLMGGFSSSYFHTELVTYPQVDLVMRGDSTEVPVADLMAALERGSGLGEVQNLTWKENGKVRVNSLSFSPPDLDYLDIDYGWMIRSVIKHRDLEGFKPFKDWDRYPLTAVFSARGCSMNCVVCGGSCSVTRGFLGRSRPAFRSPEKLARDVYNIQCYLDAPTFVVGDLRQPGRDYAERFFREARRLGVRNHLVLEVFTPAAEDFYRTASKSRGGYSVQFSPDSHDPEVRRALGRGFVTESMESAVKSALGNGCERFDVFFMIGLPQQTRESALASADYARRLYSVVDDDRRLFVYTSPLAPFLDPGSRAFEEPDRFGYRLFARTLEDHRARLASPGWKYVLSYETVWMTRDVIVDTSYDAADRLNRARMDAGQITEPEMVERVQRTDLARRMAREVDRILAIPDDDARMTELENLKEEADAIMDSTICEKRDLEWKAPGVYRSLPRVVTGLLKKRSK